MYLFDAAPDSEKLTLTPEAQKEIRAFDEEIAAAQARRMALVREAARSQGLCAPVLEDLKSTYGEPFVEAPPLEVSMKVAIVWGNNLPGKSEIREMAYLCRDRYAGDDQTSCGWVRGKPVEQKYNDIGTLGGSAGVRYACWICGKQVGELRGVHS